MENNITLTYNDIEIKTNIIKNLLLMLIERKKVDKKNFDKYLSIFLKNLNEDHETFIELDNKKIFVKFINRKITTIKKITDIENFMSNNDKHYKFIIVSNASNKAIKQLLEYNNCEVFNDYELKINIKRVIKKIRFNEGSNVLVRTLNNNGYHTNLVTGGFQPISTYVGKVLGFKKVISNRFVIKNNKFTGEYIPITGKQNSKLAYLNEICKKKSLDKFKYTLSVGDGANDLGMLQNSGLGVGYHSHQIIKKAVDNHIQFTDLKTILFYLGFTEKEFSK